MTSMDSAVLQLQEDGVTSFRPHGQSMTPRIMSGDLVTVTAVEPDAISVGDVVLCRVHGIIRLHLVSAIDRKKRRVQISNNHGHVNGWTSYDRIYGRMQ